MEVYIYFKEAQSSVGIQFIFSECVEEGGNGDREDNGDRKEKRGGEGRKGRGEKGGGIWQGRAERMKERRCWRERGEKKN